MLGINAPAVRVGYAVAAMDDRSDHEAAPEADSDAALVARCNRGDAAAWTLLVQRYQRLVYTIARRAGLDEHTAADVFQTVFSRLLTHLSRLNQADRLRAWIVTTSKREALLQRSRAARLVSLTPHEDEDASSAPELADDGPLPDAALETLQMQHQVREALEHMDERCRTLLTLLYHEGDEGLAYDEVARRLDMPVGSIGPTRARCLGKLRKLLEA